MKLGSFRWKFYFYKMRAFSYFVDIIFIIYIDPRNLASNQTLDRHGGDAPLPGRTSHAVRYRSFADVRLSSPL